MKKNFTKTILLKNANWIVFFAILFSFSLAQAATIRVTSLADAGAGTLRQAILDANATVDADEIVFDISGEIALITDLPIITESLTINGASAPNYDGITPQIIIRKTFVYQSVFDVRLVDYFELNAIAIPNIRGNHYKVKTDEVVSAIVKNCDFRNDGSVYYSGYGLYFTEVTNAEVTDNKMGNIRIGFYLSTNIILERNVFTSFVTTTTNLSNYVGGGIIKLGGVDANIANIVSIKDNTFENINGGIFELRECKNLVISTGNRPNTHIQIPSNVQASVFLDMFECENIKIYDVDLSNNIPQLQEYGLGMLITECDNTLIDNVTIKRRWNAFRACQVEDITVINSDFRDCATNYADPNSNYEPYAIEIDQVYTNLVPNGILMYNNQFGTENYTGLSGGADTF